MIDLRLWRILLLGVPMALVVAMFSLQEVPEPLAPSLPPDAFEGTAATSLAKDLAAEAPEPRPGSDDDESNDCRQKAGAIQARVDHRRKTSNFRCRLPSLSTLAEWPSPRLASSS